MIISSFLNLRNNKKYIGLLYRNLHKMTTLSTYWVSQEEDEHIIYSDFTETLAADLTLNDNVSLTYDGYLFVAPDIEFNVDTSGNTLTINGLFALHTSNIYLLTGSTYDNNNNVGTIQNGDESGNITGFGAGDWLFYLGTGIDSNMGAVDVNNKLYQSAISFATTARNEKLTSKVAKTNSAEKAAARTSLQSSEKKRRYRQWGVSESQFDTTVANILESIPVNGFLSTTTIDKIYLTDFMDGLGVERIGNLVILVRVRENRRISLQINIKQCSKRCNNLKTINNVQLIKEKQQHGLINV